MKKYLVFSPNVRMFVPQRNPTAFFTSVHHKLVNFLALLFTQMVLPVSNDAFSYERLIIMAMRGNLSKKAYCNIGQYLL